MPDSPAERIAFFVGLATIVALALSLIPAYRHYRHHPAASGASPLITRGSSSPNEQTSYRPSPAPAAPATPAPKPVTNIAAGKAKPAVAQTVKLTLAATRGDCWAEIHQDSANGKLVFEGTLVKGKTFDVVVRRLWIRFGAPQNVDLTVNGKKASIPSGTLNVLVTRAGVQPAA